MLREVGHQLEEHLSGEEGYRLVSPCPCRYHRPLFRCRAGRWGAAHRHCPGQRSWARAVGSTSPVAEANRGPRSGQDHSGSGGDPGVGWGLPGRHCPGAGRTRPLWASRVRPDRVPHNRRARHQRDGGAKSDRHRPRGGASHRVGVGRRPGAGPRHRRRPAADPGPGRHAGRVALGERARHPPSSGGLGSTRCARSSTTARPGPGSRCTSCCGSATPAPIPPPTTSRW